MRFAAWGVLLTVLTMLPARADACADPPRIAHDPPVIVDATLPGADPSIVRTAAGVLLLAVPGVGVSTVWRSVDGGRLWAPAPPAPAAGGPWTDLTSGAPDVHRLDASERVPSVTVSRDDGLLWRPAGTLPTVAGVRPWLGAAADGTLYLTVNTDPLRRVHRSTDGGLTFPTAVALAGGVARPAVTSNGVVFASYTRFGTATEPGQVLGMSRARPGEVAATWTTFASGLTNLDGDAVAADAAGTVYVVWVRRPGGIGEPDGVWYASSRDGIAFSAPFRVDRQPGVAVTMPLAVAAGPGRLAIAWLASNFGYRREDPGSDGAIWNLHVAVSADASTCRRFEETVAASGIHLGRICRTGCDARMGRFLSGTTLPDGRLVLAYPTTVRGGPWANPAVVSSVTPVLPDA